MSAAARTSLARELRPGLPDEAAEWIGQRTASFADVFTVAGADRLVDLIGAEGTAAVAVVDAVIDAVLPRTQPSVEARLLAWAGGVLTAGQADQGLAVLGEHPDPAGDPEVVRAGGLARLRDPASAHIRAQTALLSAADRRALAAAVLSEASHLASDPDATLIDRTVARLAAHRVRDDLDPSADLTQVQCLLIRGLEQLGDPVTAYQVATTALAELPRNEQTTAQRADLLKAWLRLARPRPSQPDDPLIKEAVGLATSGGALPGLEAKVWAAVKLLQRPGRHQAAWSLVDQLITDLGTYPGRDPAAGQWRLLLAFHAGQAGYSTATQQLLASVINGGTPDQQNAAQAILRALEGPRADIRLQIIILETELQAIPEAADDDRLRIHHALALGYNQLGDHTQALRHGTKELACRCHLQHPDHPDVLSCRYHIAGWTGQCGSAAAAVRLYQDLLVDQIRVSGSHHPDTLTIRNNIAYWTARGGNVSEALRLWRALLIEQERHLGHDNRATLHHPQQYRGLYARGR